MHSPRKSKRFIEPALEMRPSKILLVCTGNLTRSPMAEFLLKRIIERLGIEQVEVRSAGVFAAAIATHRRL